MVKALLKPRKETSSALLTPAEQGTYSIRRAGRLVRGTLYPRTTHAGYSQSLSCPSWGGHRVPQDLHWIESDHLVLPQILLSAFFLFFPKADLTLSIDRQIKHRPGWCWQMYKAAFKYDKSSKWRSLGRVRAAREATTLSTSVSIVQPGKRSPNAPCGEQHRTVTVNNCN